MSGYYDVPLLKKPVWTWEVPLYFFVGGAAGAAAMIGVAADLGGAKRTLVRDARRSVVPHRVDERIGRHDLVGPAQQQAEHQHAA